MCLHGKELVENRYTRAVARHVRYQRWTHQPGDWLLGNSHGSIYMFGSVHDKRETVGEMCELAFVVRLMGARRWEPRFTGIYFQ